MAARGFTTPQKRDRSPSPSHRQMTPVAKRANTAQQNPVPTSPLTQEQKEKRAREIAKALFTTTSPSGPSESRQQLNNFPSPSQVSVTSTDAVESMLCDQASEKDDNLSLTGRGVQTDPIDEDDQYDIPPDSPILSPQFLSPGARPSKQPPHAAAASHRTDDTYLKHFPSAGAPSTPQQQLQNSIGGLPTPPKDWSVAGPSHSADGFERPMNTPNLKGKGREGDGFHQLQFDPDNPFQASPQDNPFQTSLQERSALRPKELLMPVFLALCEKDEQDKKVAELEKDLAELKKKLKCQENHLSAKDKKIASLTKQLKQIKH